MLLELLLALATCDANLDMAIEYMRVELLPQLKREWVEAGVMEEEENRFMLVYWVEYDLNCMFDRQSQLRPDHPPLWWEKNLPSVETLRHYYRMQSAFIANSVIRLPFLAPNQQVNLQLLIEDTERRHRIYDLMIDVKSKYYDYSGRKLKLQEIRDLVGHKEFDSGMFPHPLPDAVTISGWSPPK